MSKKKEPKVTFNESLPIIPVDNLWINVSKDGLCYLRFFLVLPEEAREQAKLLIQENDLRSILDELCKHLNHFPEKKKPIKKIKETKKRQI
jgi:hypothetical protein